jgi:hypothetical protein
LALVKDGRITSMVEKRANLSINVWLRMPGITAFCILTLSAWLKPPPGTPPSDLMPVWGFLPMIALVFYNGQYYGMRVIGNYYIRLTQEMAKKGDDGRRVELHAS